jgi:dipeptidyl aminopeptidase/acylaminoacyl peptidase
MLMRFAMLVPLLALPVAAPAQPPARRPIVPTDFYRLKDVGSPVVSPDGAWVAYTVSTPDSAKDKRNTDLYMVSWDGSRTVQLTSSPDGESSPQWSSDNRYLSFLSSRGDEEKGAQLWLLDRLGGEAQKVTDVKQGIGGHQWSPDGKRLVFVIQDPDPDTAAAKEGEKKTPKPIVIDRWDFKRDGEGYLTRRRTHLYLFDLATRKLEQLTRGDFDDAVPAWSPDGSRIVFSSKRAPGSERSDNWDLWLIDAKAGAEPTQLTTFPGDDNGGGGGPEWSPDGKWIAYLQGGEPKYWAYTHNRIAVIPAAGGAARVLTETLDRPASQPHWSPDGKSIHFLLEDDRVVQVARVDVGSGRVERLTDGLRAFASLASNAAGKVAVLAGSDTEPYEVAAFESGSVRRLSRHNDSLMATLELGSVERLTSKSKDGTVVSSLVYLPPGYQRGRRYPLALHIHGGPFAQEQHDFDYMRQIFAARGYAVLAVNYRGSSGRGEAFSKAIYADWGNKEVVDLLGAVDQAVAQGIADPERMVLGGWSYGGILTDATIATDRRFKAGVSGAGSALQLTMYGTDQYIHQYEQELGVPWKNPDAWMKVSHPFFNADRITTPTLFMGGERDFNVPITGSEQMYQALKSNGIETELVVYPGMFHGPSAPSHRVDIVNRYIQWWEKYVRPTLP